MRKNGVVSLDYFESMAENRHEEYLGRQESIAFGKRMTHGERGNWQFA